MDILSGIGFDWQVALVNFLNFLLIFWVLQKFVFPKISESIKNRKEIVKKSLDDAKEIDLKLEVVDEETKKIIRTAEKKAENILKESVSLGKEKEEDLLEGAKNKAKEILDKGKKLGVEEKEKIIKSADAEIAKLAILSAEKVLDK